MDMFRLKSMFFITHLLAAASAASAAAVVVTVMVLDVAWCTLVLSWCGRSHMVTFGITQTRICLHAFCQGCA